MNEPELLTYIIERADSGVYSALDENDHLDYHNNMNLVFSSLNNEMKNQINLKQYNQKRIDNQNQLKNHSIKEENTFDSSTRKKSVSLMRFISHENDQLISLQDAQHILNLFFNNHFERADNLTEKYLQYQSNNVLYIKFVRAICAFIQAIIVHDKATYDNAQKYVRDCFELCLKRRPRRGLNLFNNNNFHSAKVNFYSEQEIHAELCYADCQLMLLALDSISDGKEHFDQIFNSVKLKTCFNAYKSCFEILNKRTFYQNEVSRNEFKLGVFFGLGIINMFTQDLPASIQSSMKFDLDLSFDYETALEDASSQLHIRQLLAIIFQIIYKVHHQETFGECHNFDNIERILRYALEQYSESCILHYLDGKFKQLTGQLTAAVTEFESCLEICLADSNTLIRSLQYHCEYNLAICFAIKQQWLKAADASLFLTNSSQELYSPILTRYMYNIFMYMHFFSINYDLYDDWNGYLDNNLIVNNHNIEFKLTNADSNPNLDCNQERNNESGCSSRTERSESLTYSSSRTNSMTDSINNIISSNSWKTKLDDIHQFQNNNSKRLIDEKLEQMTEREFNDQLINQFDIISKFKCPKGKQFSSIEILCIINANKYLKTGRLVLPAIELFYWLDIFIYLSERKDLVNSIMKLIEIELIEEDELKDEPNADMDNFSLLYLLKGVCLETIQEYDSAIKCFKEILYCEKRIKRDKHILHFCLLQLPLVLIKNSKHLEALYYLDKEKELCRDDLAKLFGQVTSSTSLNIQKIFTTKIIQLDQALSKLTATSINGNNVQENEKRKLNKKRNSIAAIQLNTFQNPVARRPSTNHLKQLIRQRTMNSIICKDELKDGFKDSLLEANLAKRCNQNRRSSLSDFIKNSLFGN